jgi:hypothetical protein
MVSYQQLKKLLKGLTKKKREKYLNKFYGEGVGTSNFTTMTGVFFHNVKNGFCVDHYIEKQCLFSWSLLRKSELRKEWKERRKSLFCQIFEVILPMP